MSLARRSVVIVDYGMGNLFSLERVISYLGAEANISQEPTQIASAECLILPGVGAFGDGIGNLKRRGLVDAITDFVSTGRPLLGICLGMQLLLTESEEFGLHRGLDLIGGSVKRLSKPGPSDAFYKIPHIGWNRLYCPTHMRGEGWHKTIFRNLRDGTFVYFVHSYVAIPESPEYVLSETVYGNNRFCSALQRGNIFGCQFHPEVSGKTGLEIIKSFLFDV